MSSRIHSTAVVDPAASLADDVEVGPHAVVGPGVELGAGTVVGAGARVQGPSRFGPGNRIYPNACVGFDPQDLKYDGEEVFLEVGEGNIFREFCTVHRGTAGGGGVTRIGDANLFMVYTHVAHDCSVGDHTIFVNGGTLGGHVEVQDHAVIGAYTSVHPFCRIGRHAYIGGYSVITRDVLPYSKAVGQRPACLGVNRIGLQRRGFSEEAIRHLERALKTLIRSRAASDELLDALRREHAGSAEVELLASFVAGSERGVIRTPPGRRGARGAGED